MSRTMINLPAVCGCSSRILAPTDESISEARFIR